MARVVHSRKYFKLGSWIKRFLGKVLNCCMQTKCYNLPFLEFLGWVALTKEKAVSNFISHT
jgi:hypothetical protein